MVRFVWWVGLWLLSTGLFAHADFKLDPRVVVVTQASQLEPGGVTVLGLYLHAAYATHSETGKQYFLLDSRADDLPVIPLNEQGYFREDDLLTHLSETLPSGQWLPSKQMKKFNPSKPRSGFVQPGLLRYVPYIETSSRGATQSLVIIEANPDFFADQAKVVAAFPSFLWNHWYSFHYKIAPLYFRIHRETVLGKSLVVETTDAYFSRARSQPLTSLIVPYGKNPAEEFVSIPIADFESGGIINEKEAYEEYTFSIPFTDRRYSELFFERLLNLNARDWQLVPNTAFLSEGTIKAQICSGYLVAPRCTHAPEAWIPLQVHYTAVDPKKGEIYSVEFGGFNDRKKQKYYPSDDSLLSAEVLKELKEMASVPKALPTKKANEASKTKAPEGTVFENL